jgi:hypothetical protein
LSQNDIIVILRGKWEVFVVVKKLVWIVFMFKDEFVVLNEIILMVLSFLEKKGFSEEVVLKMLMDYAPILDLDMTTPLWEEFMKVLIFLLERIDASEDEFIHMAGIICPYCGEFFLV